MSDRKIIEDAQCMLCFKPLNKLIYETDDISHKLCNKCLKKAKFIDNKQVVTEYVKSVNAIKKDTKKLIKNIQKELDRLSDLKVKYNFNDFNDELLFKKKKYIAEYHNELLDLIRKSFDESTMLAK